MSLQIVETMPHTENVEQFLEKLGDFYEMIDDTADRPLSHVMKRNIPRREMKVNGADLTTNGVTRCVDSSPETSDTLHSDLSSHGVNGLYCLPVRHCYCSFDTVGLPTYLL